jgi:hypothetical protein
LMPPTTHAGSSLSVPMGASGSSSLPTGTTLPSINEIEAAASSLDPVESGNRQTSTGLTIRGPQSRPRSPTSPNAPRKLQQVTIAPSTGTRKSCGLKGKRNVHAPASDIFPDPDQDPAQDPQDHADTPN